MGISRQKITPRNDNYLFFWYNPIISAWATILPCIFSSRKSLENHVDKGNILWIAYTLKVYLCTPCGGQGAHRPSSHHEFCPDNQVEISCSPISIVWAEIGMFASNKWSHIQPTASGSSTMTARDCADKGISLIVNVGKLPTHSQV